MDYPKYYGNYLGIIVQNNDPLRQGRVKVFVPHISPNIYSKWNEVVRDKKFKFIGANTYSDLTDIVDDLKKVLPWATLATPLVGENSSGRFNSFYSTGSISDSSSLEDTFNKPDSNEINTDELTQYNQNLDNIGEKPGNLFDITYYKLKDAFSNPVENNANNINKFSFNYTPECYSNCAKGSFPILNVGTHVWVFFKEGDPNYPVIFASALGGEDFRGIFDVTTTDTALSALKNKGLDYPGEYENDSLPTKQDEDTGQTITKEYSINTETYRNKYVINQKGGTIAFVNSDNREMLKLTHYSGSFKEFNNFTNIELATNNDQKLVLNDQFLTVRGTRNEFTELDYDNIVKGDFYRKVGNLNYDLHKQWKDVYKEIAEAKQLFDIQRCEAYTNNRGVKLTSSKQSKSGTEGKCPVCNSEETTYFVYNNKTNEWINLIYPSTANAEGDFIFSRGFSDIGSILQTVSEIGTQGQPRLVSAIDNLDFANSSGVIFGTTCPACGGSGTSPSSFGGTYTEDATKKQIGTLYADKISELAKIEKLMGVGGSEIVEITKHKIETIGMVMNDSGAIRVDMKGKMNISDVSVAKYGTYYGRQPTPLIELVNVDDFPGGNYTLNIGNKYNVLVGAGGINLKSYGVVNISGAVSNIAGEQVNLSSELETNIDGGKRLSLTADVVSIKNRNLDQVVVEGSLGVTNNVVIAGGLHVEGEITGNHITIPTEMQATEACNAFAAPITDAANLNGACIGFGLLMNNAPTTVTKGGATYYKYNPIKSFTGPPYIGFTDPLRICGRLQLGSIIGWTASMTGGIQPVYASSTGTPGGTDVPVFGSGPGANLPTPVGEIEFDGCIKAITTSFGIGAAGGPVPNDAIPSMMPVMVLGTGRDNDCIKVETHSHTFRGIPTTLTQTNFEVRDRIAGVKSPINCEPISHGKKS
ncbi:hypothetical protein EBR43_02180 [bacterium]|nr:hypothetical protein [bacterium]